VDFLNKPIDRSRLQAVLGRHLTRRPGRVLVVDDNDDDRQLLREILTDLGITVTTADNGAEALTRMSQTTPDLVLVDLMMPVMDGMTFIQRVRDDPAYPSVPIVVVSSKDLTREERGRLRGVIAVVEKGVQLEADLRGVMRQALGEG
jgi:CheY-like chemotaxis protein